MKTMFCSFSFAYWVFLKYKGKIIFLFWWDIYDAGLILESKGMHVVWTKGYILVNLGKFKEETCPK